MYAFVLDAYKIYEIKVSKILIKSLNLLRIKSKTFANLCNCISQPYTL